MWAWVAACTLLVVLGMPCTVAEACTSIGLDCSGTVTPGEWPLWPLAGASMAVTCGVTPKRMLTLAGMVFVLQALQTPAEQDSGRLLEKVGRQELSGLETTELLRPHGSSGGWRRP
eukprot:TRINITY_DN16589_c0_g1_i2.p2 TRINITY_DN16589_c0_g1~~TRINITY_DN16589_c0_g1_i2.p2  ORF type:complete len:116 (+),score=35.40 TRINITY_DN16589_c0_g1_i2:49-396(+)